MKPPTTSPASPAENIHPRTSTRRRLLPYLALIPILALAVYILDPFVRSRLTPDQIWDQAELDFQAGRWEQAEAGLKRLNRLRKPTDADLLLSSQLNMAHERVDQAIQTLNLIPDNSVLAAQARLSAGQLELRRDRLPSAEQYYLKAITLEPKLVPARRELIYVYGMQLRRPELNTQFLALADFATLSYDDVFTWCLTRGTTWESKEHSAILQEYIKADPSDRWSRLALSSALRSLNQIEEAMQVLDPLPEDDPDAIAARARVAVDRGDIPSALKLLEKAPEHHAECCRLRGQLAIQMRDSQNALKYYELAYKVEPNNRETVFGLSRAYQLAGQREKAEPFLWMARDLDRLSTLVSKAANESSRKDIQFLLNIAQACETVGRIPEAKCWLKVAVTMHPTDPRPQKALFRLAQVSPPQSPSL